MPEKLDYLNVGCGGKYHREWVNVDMVSDSPYVIKSNLIQGIPFPDQSFSVVYHSQVLEHIPRDDAKPFIRECFRVLKQGGIIRIVVPDLEDLARKYLDLLNENSINMGKSHADYEWILLEMYDQQMRNNPGGLMAEYLRKDVVENEKFVLDRIGFVGKSIRENYKSKKIRRKPGSFELVKTFIKQGDFSGLFSYFRKGLVTFLLTKEENDFLETGRFRKGGEVHYWMYDRYSLTKLLSECGFTDVKIQSPLKSSIPGWDLYELDVKNGEVYDPASLFIEAKKPG